MWCVPKLNEEFKERMEDVLDCYEKPFNPKEPVIGVDETSKQLLKDKRLGSGCKKGKVARRDYEYQRNGTRNLFVMVQVHAPKRKVKVTHRRKKSDFAEFLKEISEEEFPKAKRIHLIMDNLNTHFESSLTERFGQREGKKIWNRFVPHYTPKHASWLNVAENEIGILSRQCLKRRIGDGRTMNAQVKAWTKKRNEKKIITTWKFSTKEAKEKFPDLYN